MPTERERIVGWPHYGHGMARSQRTSQRGLKQLGVCLPESELRPLLKAAANQPDLELRRCAATGNRFCRIISRGRKPVHCERPACAAAYRRSRAQGDDGSSAALAQVSSATVVRLPIEFTAPESDLEAAVEQLEDALLGLTADYARGGRAADPAAPAVVVAATLVVRAYRKDKR